MSPDKERNGPATGMTAELEMEVSGRFLAIVRDLVWELHPHLRRAVHVELDSDFDRDLALDSLGRAELILRVDRAFKVRLPDQLLSEADTPRELLMAVLSAGPERRALPEIAAMTAAEQPEISAPVSAQTLIDALEHHVHAHGRRLHLRIWRGEGDETCVSYDDLREASCRIASGLLERGLVVGDRVAIMPADGRHVLRSLLWGPLRWRRPGSHLSAVPARPGRRASAPAGWHFAQRSGWSSHRNAGVTQRRDALDRLDGRSAPH